MMQIARNLLAVVTEKIRKISMPSQAPKNSQQFSRSVDFEPPHHAEMIYKALASNFIFMDLSDEQRNLFIDAMQMETVKEEKDDYSRVTAKSRCRTLWTAMKTWRGGWLVQESGS
jgi:hypothetical protein